MSHGELEQFLVGDGRRAGEVPRRCRAPPSRRCTRSMSSPPGSWMPPRRVADGDDLGALWAISVRGDRADVAEALDRDRGAVRSSPRCLAASTMQYDDAAAGRLVAALGAAEARSACRSRHPGPCSRVHRVGVHDPGHGLGVGVDVRRRDVALGPDEDARSRSRSGASAAPARACESCFGSTMTPPLAPPYGMPTTAHFQVIHIARALTSSRVTSGW